MAGKDERVWDVYDLYRTASLNVKYYGGRLDQLQKYNFAMELILAATASSSAIAAFAFWKTPIGASVWQVLGALAAVLAILKPLLKLTDRIRKLEEVITGFRVLEHDLRKITTSISQQQVYDKAIATRFLAALDRMDDLVIKYAENKEDKALKKRSQEEVLRELPVDSFYIPKKQDHEV